LESLNKGDLLFEHNIQPAGRQGNKTTVNFGKE
jgi:hypothetical protein